MPDRGAVDGKTKVTWVASIANIAAPTATALNSGTALDAVLTPDGLVGFQADTQEVDASSLNSTFTTKRAGRAEYSGTMLRLKRQTATDTLFDTTLARGQTGYIVIRRGLAASGNYAASDKVEVYPVECGEVRFLDPEPNTMERYEVPLFITSEPNLRSTVA